MLPLILMGAKMAQDMAKEKGDRLAAATTQAYSPWTGMKAGPIQSADIAGTAAGTAGGMMAQGQADDKFAADQDLQKQQMQMQYLKMGKQSPWSGMAPSSGRYNPGMGIG